jgi:hypothetical protein
MSFMPNNNRVLTSIEAPRTVLRVYDVRTNPTTTPFNQPSGTGTILRVHDLNDGSVREIHFNRNY